MPIRCPKCNFDSADDAAWCDFCKEPFRTLRAKASPEGAQGGGLPPAEPKKEPEPKPAAASPVPAKVTSASDLPPEVRERLAKAEKLLSAGDGDRMPAIPQWFRFLAWAFLGAWFLTGMLLAGNLLARRNAAAKDPVLDAR